MSTASLLRHLVLVAGLVGGVTPGSGGVLLGGEDTDGPAPRAATSIHPPVDVAALRRSWSWPLAPRPPVTRAFSAPTSTWGAGHRGIDLAAGQGQPVMAVDEGVVTHVGQVAGRGTITVTHESGLRSTYEPVQGRVRVGDRVASGAVVGVVLGRTHCGGRCLHLGALVGDSYLDPRPLLRGGPVILLPLRASRG